MSRVDLDLADPQFALCVRMSHQVSKGVVKCSSRRQTNCLPDFGEGTRITGHVRNLEAGKGSNRKPQQRERAGYGQSNWNNALADRFGLV